MNVEVTIRENNVALTVYVKDDLSRDGRCFGYLEVHDGSFLTRPVFWDNLFYFINIDAKKKESIKDELKAGKAFYTGVVKDIKKVFKKAFELGIIVKK